MFIFEELMRFILMPCGPIPSPPCATSHALAGGGSIEDEGRRTGVQPRRSPGPRGRWLPGVVSPMKRATLQERIWPFAVSQRSVCEPHSSLCISTSPVIAVMLFLEGGGDIARNETQFPISSRTFLVYYIWKAPSLFRQYVGSSPRWLWQIIKLWFRVGHN